MAWKKVGDEEFVKFLASYPMPLVITKVFEDGAGQPVARATEDSFSLWVADDEQAPDGGVREEMIRNDAFGDIANMGKPR